MGIVIKFLDREAMIINVVHANLLLVVALPFVSCNTRAGIMFCGRWNGIYEIEIYEIVKRNFEK